MSDYTIPTSNTVTTIDPQATKIRELQSDVNELKELVEYLRDKIKHLKREIELFREHADYGDISLVEAILKGEAIGRKEKESKP
jgi:predicted RNase H-like nuclease (RuvC/YqgF family)